MVSLAPSLVGSLQSRRGDEAGWAAISSKLGCKSWENRTDQRRRRSIGECPRPIWSAYTDLEMS